MMSHEKHDVVDFEEPRAPNENYPTVLEQNFTHFSLEPFWVILCSSATHGPTGR